MNANGSVTLQGFARKVVRHVELIIDKPSHGSVDSDIVYMLAVKFIELLDLRKNPTFQDGHYLCVYIFLITFISKTSVALFI